LRAFGTVTDAQAAIDLETVGPPVAGAARPRSGREERLAAVREEEERLGVGE